MTEEQKRTLELRFQTEWRELGFYYDFEDKKRVPEWRFFGSKNGLKNIIDILEKYISNPTNQGLSEHEHYGPYHYLKIMTWNLPTITDNYIAGTLEDLANLKSIIAERLSNAKVGDAFNLQFDYGIKNKADAKFFIMEDEFDPSSMDNFVWFEPQEELNKIAL